MTKITVSQLLTYPVKSCRGIELQSTMVEDFGLKDDRRWMVVDENGMMLTQRKLSAMCLINTVLTETGIMLSALTMEPLQVTIPGPVNTCKVKVWDDECYSYDAGDEAAKWLSRFLGVTCRLVYFPADEIRQVDLNFANKGDKTAFSDGFPLLLISQASLEDLNSRLYSPVSMNRFRPNIVVQGCQPYEEDSWKKIKIGDILYHLVKPCSRCVIPSINPETAEREDELTKTLIGYRKRDNKIFFGQNVIAQASGQVDVGMRIEVIE
ncbi:MAG: MOSC domain-containing protein [Gammaproteobacteria bacterium]|nr:MOSC domain-containing protein [Gammaproteobacteria bacterium]